MPRIRFDHLVTALADAVVDAEHVIRRHQLSDIRSFFDADNHPVMVDLDLPRSDPGARPGELARLQVPLIAMVNVTHLAIEEMEITFTTELGSVSEEVHERAHAVGGADPDAGPTAREHQGWSGRKRVTTIDVETGPEERKQGAATVTLKVRAGEVPEGVSRLLARLNKLI
ncbi:DUF2589 domain-containing protein [Nannocystis sp. ILAH1]|uniref:DUF2589 domain-containing protein n=1 Tax=Nannocystis sp. ILAH1 TaxID=2996789 RepID=UPI00226D7FD0|nr:DUF2589 domain-containing protein [Nannocystis sp. ILAH1]MCY0994912.1 DUF2589 domain-containing protein [Nannocystis sp. ILAH1]